MIRFTREGKIKRGELLFLEESDNNEKLRSRLRGNHVDYVVAPKSFKDNKDFLEQVQACISSGAEHVWGEVLYYE